MTRRTTICGAAMALLLASSATLQTPPAVVKLDPPHGASAVDPGRVTRLQVTFDQDMDPSMHAVCGGGPSFPKVLGTSWENARTFVVDVKLAEDSVYSMDLSCAASSGFHSKAGQRLPAIPWRIATAGPRLPDGVAEQAIERLFLAIADRYSYRDRLGIDWGDLQRSRHSDLVSAPSGAALALAVVDLLQVAEDPHISVSWRDATLPSYRRLVVANFDGRQLQKTFPGLARIGRIGAKARTEDGIGYVFVSSFDRDQRDEFESVLEAVRSLLDCKAIVLDVRANGGGDELMARRLAAFFVPGEKVYAAHRVRDPKAAGGFQERQDRRLRGNEPPDLFIGPVAVLMGPMNMSSCEAFLLMMKQSPQAVLVGASSYGSSGNPQPHLIAPGLSVMLPSWQALRPDGSSFEGEGITPHIHVPVKATPDPDHDPVLGEALMRLRGKR